MLAIEAYISLVTFTLIQEFADLDLLLGLHFELHLELVSELKYFIPFDLVASLHI